MNEINHSKKKGKNYIILIHIYVYTFKYKMVFKRCRIKFVGKKCSRAV